MGKMNADEVDIDVPLVGRPVDYAELDKRSGVSR